MSDNGVPIDLQAVVARVKQWLAEGKDVHLSATRAAVRDFPMIDMRDGRGVEVVTSAGVIRERIEPPRVQVVNSPQKREVTSTPAPPSAARVVPATLTRQHRLPAPSNHRAVARPQRAQP